MTMTMLPLEAMLPYMYHTFSYAGVMGAAVPQETYMVWPKAEPLRVRQGWFGGDGRHMGEQGKAQITPRVTRLILNWSSYGGVYA